MAEGNIPEVYKLDEGDHVELVTEQDVSIRGEVTHKTNTHPKDPNEVWEQTTWEIEADDGETYSFGRLDGLKKSPGESPYPKHFPLTREAEEYRAQVPEEDNFGLIDEMRYLETA